MGPNTGIIEASTLEGKKPTLSRSGRWGRRRFLPIRRSSPTSTSVKRGTDWVLTIPPSMIAPLGVYVLMPRKGEPISLPVQGPLTREQEASHQSQRMAFAQEFGELLGDLYLKGKLGCLEHQVRPLDIVVDTPAGTFAACSRCHAAGVYVDVIGIPRPA